MLAVVAIVLVANLPYLSGLTDPNPVGPGSGIAVTQPGFVRGASTLDPTAAYITHALGRLAASDVLHGRLPLWNPYEGAGMPLLGEGQSAALFPPTLLLALNNGLFWEELLLELVAALATFAVLRRIGAGRVASVAGAAAFGLNGAFAWLTTTTFNPIAFLPLLVLGIELTYGASRSGRRGGWWLIAVALALSLYAGFPETTYIDSLVALLWFLWRCGSGDRTHVRRLVIKSAAGVAAGLLLAAPFLVAFAGALPHEYVGIHTTDVGATPMPPYAFPQLLLPYVYGMPLAFHDPAGVLQMVWGYAGGYVTASLLFLAVLALAFPARRGLKLLLIAWLAVALATVYGQPPVLRSILLVLPGASEVTFYRYTFPAISFALAVLAALGIDGLAEDVPRLRSGLAVSAGMLALIAVAAYAAHRLVVRLTAPSSSHWATAQIAWTAAVLIALSACVLWRVTMPRWRLPSHAWIVAVIVVADVGAMFALHELAAPRAVRLDDAPVAYLQRHLGLERFFTLGPIAPNYGGYWSLASLNDIDLPLPSAWTRYINARLDTYVNPIFFVGNNGGGRSPAVPTPAQELLAHLPAYQNAGVGFVVTLPATRLNASSLTLVRRTRVASIYHLAGSRRYYTGSAGCVVRPDDRQTARVSCPRGGSLTRRELAFSGWSAAVDAHAAPIRVADGIFQSVAIPAGDHVVSFSYRPRYFGLSLVGLLAGAVWLVLGAWVAPRLGR